MVTRGNVRDTTSPPRFRLGYAILPSLLPAKQGSPYPGGEGGQKVSPTVTTSGREISFIDFSSVNSRGKKKEHFCPTGDWSWREVREATVSRASLQFIETPCFTRIRR